MSSETMRGFALIGAGLFGEQHAKAYQRHRSVRFEAVCDRDDGLATDRLRY